jgi:6-pyruvoyltetrahydropterin/6-carboxytetrahydropterin synthase
MSEEGVTCASCGEKRATVRVTTFMDGRPVQQQLCDKCYRNTEEGATAEGGALTGLEAHRPTPMPAAPGDRRGAVAGEQPSGTYELVIEDTFAAAHNLRGYKGDCERLHGHNWRVEVRVSADELDELGMVVDFRELKARLAEVLAGLDHTHLNEVQPFDKINPTTENICRHIAEQLQEKLPRRVSIRRVSCWESDACGASFVP